MAINSWTATADIDASGAETATFQMTGSGGTAPAEAGGVGGRLDGEASECDCGDGHGASGEVPDVVPRLPARASEGTSCLDQSLCNKPVRASLLMSKFHVLRRSGPAPYPCRPVGRGVRHARVREANTTRRRSGSRH
ncbi:hypothetical protein GCM10027176_35840 [Actinoallomurus bryophytorum]